MSGGTVDWFIAYQWGEKPGEYSRRGVEKVEAADVRGALAEWDRRGGCVNSRIVYVAMAGAMRFGLWRARKTVERVPEGRAEA